MTLELLANVSLSPPSMRSEGSLPFASSAPKEAMKASMFTMRVDSSSDLTASTAAMSTTSSLSDQSAVALDATSFSPASASSIPSSKKSNKKTATSKTKKSRKVIRNNKKQQDASIPKTFNAPRNHNMMMMDHPSPPLPSVIAAAQQEATGVGSSFPGFPSSLVCSQQQREEDFLVAHFHRRQQQLQQQRQKLLQEEENFAFLQMQEEQKLMKMKLLQQQPKQEQGTSSIMMQRTQKLTQSVVADAIAVLLRDEEHSTNVLLKHADSELLKRTSLPGVVPLTHQVLLSSLSPSDDTATPMSLPPFSRSLSLGSTPMPRSLSLQGANMHAW
mmetsp:Transcript_18355/g.25890  ORF Transcript_18355/g.25890 Transcript_18355/m.25890 type:complete len:330 (+) Transcript_18355:150-1139(+)